MANDTSYLFITPDHVSFAAGPDDEGKARVVILTEYDSKQAPWLAPNIRLGISMTPEEARSIGQTLIRKADEAEA